jgi:2-methylcitrate dehydratase
VWGTRHVLDPVKAACDLGTMIRWLDFSDTTFTGGHPSDCIGALLGAADHASRRRRRQGAAPLTMADVLRAMVAAYEIQGLLARENRFDDPSVGLDHVIGVKLASTALATALLGGSQAQVEAALSNAVLDGHPLNAYRHVPNAGNRKSWAGGDAAGRGVWLALNAMRGEAGYPTPLTAPTWGFEAVYLGGKPVRLTPPLGSFVLDHVIFKLHPCQRNTTTAVESALRLHGWLKGRWQQVRRIVIRSHDEALRRADKTGPLRNRAARDHCIQYVVAVALIHGRLEPGDYRDDVAADPRIDALRERTRVVEDAAYTREHHDLAVRSCASAVQIELDDGSLSPLEETRFPSGDPSVRDAALPALQRKFERLTQGRRQDDQGRALFERLCDPGHLQAMPVPDFMDWVTRWSNVCAQPAGAATWAN